MELKDIRGIGDATLKKLAGLGIDSVLGLLTFLPSSYVDLCSPVSVSKAEAGRFYIFEGEVSLVSRVSTRGRREFHVLFEDVTSRPKRAFFKATFFNQPYYADVFSKGGKYRLLGKLVNDRGSYELVNPVFESADAIKTLEGVYTVYPLKGIIGQNTFKKLVANAVTHFRQTAVFSGAENEFISLLKEAHFPKYAGGVERAVAALAAYDTAFALYIYSHDCKKERKQRNVFYNLSDNRIVGYENYFDFALTPSQRQVIQDIAHDLSGGSFMSRIVTGDVGSGKTVTGFFACSAAAVSGKQAAFLAPTEILVRQHYDKYLPVADALGIKCAILTSSTDAKDSKAILAGLGDGEISVVFGTQSLLSERVVFKDLALAVIDEQHRFGVKERNKIEEKGACDILSLTATPIPRSLALSFMKDISVSETVRRQELVSDVRTKLVGDAKLGDMLDFFKRRAQEGESSLIVCPSVEDSEGYDAFSIHTLIRDYEAYFRSEGVSVIHGRLKKEEKQAALDSFVSGRSKILFATAVIEVGIDTDASNIAVLNADRFGLASLHQLRGRIGRRGQGGYCFLHYGNGASDAAIERLDAVTKMDSGSEIAEYDFNNRGAGQLLGLKQSGAAHTPLLGLPLTAEALREGGEIADRMQIETDHDAFVSFLGEMYSKIPDFIEYLRDVTLNS